jgi:hypothetical protein
MGEVRFVGQAPYAMPMTQNTKAFADGGMVEARIRLLTGPATLEDVAVLLTANQALLLSDQLARAAEAALSVPQK